MVDQKKIYKVQFYNNGELYEVYARQLSQGGLYGFVEIEEMVFGEKSTVVVDPSEERLKAEFAGVKRSYVPMHSIVRIDEVEREGNAKISELANGEGKIAVFPFTGSSPTSDRQS